MNASLALGNASGLNCCLKVSFQARILWKFFSYSLVSNSQKSKKPTANVAVASEAYRPYSVNKIEEVSQFQVFPLALIAKL